MTRVLVSNELADDETRVAATPETVRKLCSAGLVVLVERGAGDSAGFDDTSYREAGAEVVNRGAAWSDADAVLKVRAPRMDEVERLKAGAVVVSFFVRSDDPELVAALVGKRITSFSMNLVPRITRAQRMDALSSQANIAGYKAVLLAAVQLPKYFPLMMTAAGTVKPAKVVVMGAGVAGLQAIATAKRLGAQVWATDVRLAAKEQVESVGGKFIDVPGMEDMEDAGGYAKAATAEFLERQRQVVGDHIAESDVVITTALVPGRTAPVLVHDSLLARMRSGSVVVDLAAEQGGNCEGTEVGQTVVRHGVTVIGPRNLPCSVAVHASELYARNVLAFFEPLVVDGAVHLDLEDEVQAGAVVTHAGDVRHGPTADLLSTTQGGTQ
jgi:NAD(P) transhydrogenase subunit alpha